MAAADSGEGSGGSGEKTVTLVSSDGASFEVREAAASLSQTVRRMMDEAEAGGDAGGIPLPNVDARILSKVLEYCNKHAPAPSSMEGAASDAEDLEWFDREFMQVNVDTLYYLITAANYLKVVGLIGLTCQTVADMIMIKGKTPEQIRKTFRIHQSGYTPEEEEAMRRQNAWLYD